MRLLYLVKKYDRIRLPPDGLGELSTLVISDVSRRRTDQPADRMPLLILAHVDTGHHILVIEQEFRQSLGQLSLSDTRSTHEQE